MPLRDRPSPEIAEADILAVCDPGDDTIPRARRPAILSRPATRPPTQRRAAQPRASMRPAPPPVPTSSPWPKGVAQTGSPFARRASCDEEALGAIARATPPSPLAPEDAPVTSTMRTRASTPVPWLWGIGCMGAGAAISAAVFFWMTPPPPSPPAEAPSRVAHETIAPPIEPPKPAHQLTFEERDAVEFTEPPPAPPSASARPSVTRPGPQAPVAAGPRPSKAKPGPTLALPTPADVLSSALGPEPAPSSDEKRPATRARPESLLDAQLRAAATR